MAYYYLVASLPPLALDEAIPFTPETFLHSCEIHSCENLLSRADLDDVRCIVSRRPERGRHRFLRTWIGRETRLRNALARRRAAARGLDPLPFLRDDEGSDSAIERAAAEAMAADDPLRRELALDRFRWQTLDDLAWPEPFGASALFAFALKLQIADRWRRLTVERGREVLKEIVSENLKSASGGSAQ
ncbi:MAG TPA: DUF2764 family protein [Sumerlaeia bacterium]|nr:DUF2764 family protein [Sumerlaeia bacterium]